MRRATLIAVLALAVSGAAVLAAPRKAPAPPRVSYTPAQAAAGGQIYAARCAMCHGRALEGTLETPALTGKFVANWAGRPVRDIPAYLVRAMPQFAPGSLAPADAVSLTAFMLQANGYAAGVQPLSISAAMALPAPPSIAAARK